MRSCSPSERERARESERAGGRETGGTVAVERRRIGFAKKCRSRQAHRVMPGEKIFCQQCHFILKKIRAAVWRDCCVCENKRKPVEMNWKSDHYFESTPQTPGLYKQINKILLERIASLHFTFRRVHFLDVALSWHFTYEARTFAR